MMPHRSSSVSLARAFLPAASSSGLSRGSRVQQSRPLQVTATASTAGRRIRGCRDLRDKPKDDNLETCGAGFAVTRSHRAPLLYRPLRGQTHRSDPMARAHATAGNAKRLTSLSATLRNLPQLLHLLPTTSSRRRPGPTQVSAISTRPGSRSTRATRSFRVAQAGAGVDPGLRRDDGGGDVLFKTASAPRRAQPAGRHDAA